MGEDAVACEQAQRHGTEARVRAICDETPQASVYASSIPHSNADHIECGILSREHEAMLYTPTPVSCKSQDMLKWQCLRPKLAACGIT